MLLTMIITNFGRQHFKVTVGDLTIAINPVSKEGKGKVSKYGADITLITTNYPDYNGREQTEHGEKVPFVISGPGEYEVKEIFIKGFGTTTKLTEGKKEREFQNTSYVFTVDNIRITFLGALSQALTLGKIFGMENPVFLKEAGAEKIEPVEKLTIKRKDIDGKLGEVVLFHEL